MGTLSSGRRRLGGLRFALWVLLAIPAAVMVWQFQSGAVLAMDLLHPSGETAIRLMVLALLPGPLAAFFGAGRFLRGWLAIRRNLGVAAFGYALLHLAFYALDMADWRAMIEELELPSIWTGWLALVLLTIPALISYDKAMRALGRRWKTIQRLVYPALLVSLAHWVLLDWHWQPAAIHFLPVCAVWLLRAARRRRLTTRGSFA